MFYCFIFSDIFTEDLFSFFSFFFFQSYFLEFWTSWFSGRHVSARFLFRVLVTALLYVTARRCASLLSLPYPSVPALIIVRIISF